MKSRVSQGWLCMLALATALSTAACLGSGGQQIVHVTEVPGGPEIVLLDPESGEVTRLSNSPARGLSPRWSPDRRYIAYLTDDAVSVEINLRDLKEGTTRRLTDSAGVLQPPLWSPDGKRLAFVSEREGNAEVYVISADGTDETRLTFNTVPDFLGDWSPDGEWLVFYSEGPGGDSGLWLRNPQGVNLIRLTRGNDTQPAWSPDNQRIAFVRTQGDNQDIFIVDKARTGGWRGQVEEIRLTRGPARAGSPAWSPDGRYIAYVSYVEGNAEIYTMRADGSEQERLTRNATDDLSPVWSPDGKRIAFVSHLYGWGEIFVMDADGGLQRRLTNNTMEDRDPDW
jgi:Tol biopolymer transport system component